MKISEITMADVAGFLRLELGEYSEVLLEAIMNAAKQYIVSYSGVPETSADATVPTIDSYPDLTIAYLVLCQDMHENRAMTVDEQNINKVVETILGMHSKNLL